MNQPAEKFEDPNAADGEYIRIERRTDDLGRPRFWRSADELHGTGPFLDPQEFVWPEFTAEADQPPGEPSRRTFLKVMGASLALAGLYGCTRRPEEKIVPYVRQPEQLVPGVPLFFATALTLGGYARGVLVESHEGRPTKIEGNPDHPASLGATDVFMQAEILSLYDPDRSQVVTHDGDISNWDSFLAALEAQMRQKRATGGAGLRLLTETITSPTLAAQIRDLLKQFPRARWHRYDPIGCDNARAGATAAFGRDVRSVYHFDRADVIVSLDSNFLLEDPGSVRYAWEFINGRRVRNTKRQMNRLFVVEGTPTITGAMADVRLTIKASQIELAARALAHAIGAAPESGRLSAEASKWVEEAAAALDAHQGKALIVAGESQPPAVHALAHWLNQQLTNPGKTVEYLEPVEAPGASSLIELLEDIDSGSVDTLLILGGNPAYDAPADLHFTQRLSKVPLRAHLSRYNDETSYHCHWHLPESHSLESWSDARAFDGTSTIIQPLIAPLYPSKSAHELLAAVAGKPSLSGYESVRNHWQAQHGSDDFEDFWQKTLSSGVVAGSAARPVQVSAKAPLPMSEPSSGTGFEVAFRPDPCIWDGRFANNGWLQELPKPLTKLTWDNAVLMSPADMKAQGLTNGQIVELRSEGRSVTGPVWPLPGQPRGALTVHLGYGRTRAGRVGGNQQERRGFNAYLLRTLSNRWTLPGVQLSPQSATQELACTQHTQLMHGREHDLIRVEEIGAYDKAPKPRKKVPLTLYPEYPYKGNAWGMVIDQNACIGCNACVIACVSENNIPVVGKDEVARGREMHWLRVDAYYGGEDEASAEGPYFQPVPCMHCEKAPCEVVCPVNATVHDEEGLNNMVYNRCVGTRYCSNNCPYKVRRFNFYQYQDDKTEQFKLMRNPDVTVRSRGVMEKCTYCVQRINAGRIEAKKNEAAMVDAKTLQEREALRTRATQAIAQIQTACQQACPTDAIIFGNLNDPHAPVTHLRSEPTNYVLLEELNTQPRTSYLPRFRNA